MTCLYTSTVVEASVVIPAQALTLAISLTSWFFAGQWSDSEDGADSWAAGGIDTVPRSEDTFVCGR